MYNVALILVGLLGGKALAEPVELAAVPFPLSKVGLTCESPWMIAQQRNMAFLQSLNVTTLACIFTSAANLTECQAAESAFYTTYQKRAPAGWIEDDADHSLTPQEPEYDVLSGYVGGDDFAPTQSMTFQACKDLCSSSSQCAGFSFVGKSTNLPSADQEVSCTSKVQPMFFYEVPVDLGNCPTAGQEGQPVCPPLPGDMGLGGYYGHYQGHWLSATALMYNSTRDETLKSLSARLVNIFVQVEQAWEAKYGYAGYVFPYDPIVFDYLEFKIVPKPTPAIYSVPFYTTHKIMAGLLDQYVLAGNEQALELLVRMADWVNMNVRSVLERGGQDMWQKVLNTEWGGMNEVLFNLYDVTGNETHLETGRFFNHWKWSAPLADGEDDLHGNHANTHIPEVIGNLKAYELTANETDKRIAQEFFSAIVANHSYVTAGSNTGEYWGIAKQLGDNLNANTEESCTQYNILKVSRHLFKWSADPKYFDFFERALWNGILGNQNKDNGEMTQFIYFLPLGGGGVTKAWGYSNFGFRCCWGSLSEQFSKLGDSIYFQSPDSSKLYVNLFASSTLHWEEKGIEIEQLSQFPFDDSTTTAIRLTIPEDSTLSSDSTVTFSLFIRVPSWATGSNTVIVNEDEVSGIVPGQYLEILREWSSGDLVIVSFPMALSYEHLNDERTEWDNVMAFLYGPLVLAGLTDSTALIPEGEDATKPENFIRRTSNPKLSKIRVKPSGQVLASQQLIFTAFTSDGGNFTMMPFYQVMSESYTIYYNTTVATENGHSADPTEVQSCQTEDYSLSEEYDEHQLNTMALLQ